MGRLRTTNKRHKRAIATRQAKSASIEAPKQAAVSDKAKA